MTTTPTTTIDESVLDAFVGRFVQDLGAVLHAATVLVGDRLGLYQALADGGPATPAELAERTGYDARHLAEWLAAQAASGYATYEPATGSFALSPEQAFALTSEDNPLFAPGGLQVAASAIKDVDLVADAVRSGNGVAWGAHHQDLFTGTDRFFRPTYIGNLLDSWLPALDGVVGRLDAGGTVVDVGCGHGSSTVLMAAAFPRSTFLGVDTHAPSIDAARRRADEAGVAGRCRFEMAAAADFPGGGYDLVTFFDCLHDMGDPAGAAAHVRNALADNGTWMIVEPAAGDRLEDNLGPVGRVFYAASTMICVPASQSEEIGAALGAQAGQARIGEVVEGAGFTRFRRAAATPFNHVYEARP